MATWKTCTEKLTPVNSGSNFGVINGMKFVGKII